MGLDPEAWVPLAEIARPHGVRGEIRLRVFNKTSDTLLNQDEVLVRLPDGEEHEVSVDAARRADDAILIKLHSVDDRDRAEDLRGALVCVRRKDFPAAEEGEFYAVDVVGAEVRLEGRVIGKVKELLQYPTTEALLVETGEPEGDWEIPLVAQWVANVDAPAKVVELASLEGLEREPKIKVKAPKPPPPKKKKKWAKKTAAQG